MNLLPASLAQITTIGFTVLLLLSCKKEETPMGSPGPHPNMGVQLILGEWYLVRQQYQWLGQANPTDVFYDTTYSWEKKFIGFGMDGSNYISYEIHNPQTNVLDTCWLTLTPNSFEQYHKYNIDPFANYFIMDVLNHSDLFRVIDDSLYIYHDDQDIIHGQESNYYSVLAKLN